MPMDADEPIPIQGDLALPFPELSGDQPLMPARMVNEYQYCPRLAYLEWVRVVFDDELRTLTINAISGLRLIAEGGRCHNPWKDSPRCPRCSLVGICLPDEVRYLHPVAST